MTVINKGDNFKTVKIRGGWTPIGDSASENEVIINNGTFNNGVYTQYITGGSAVSSATSNKVTINKGTFNNDEGLFIYGGQAGNVGTASDNCVEINDGNFVKSCICGGQAGDGGVANNNCVKINGGNFVGDDASGSAIFGASISGLSVVNGSANNNSVEINGGTFDGATFNPYRIAAAFGSDCNNNRVTINNGEFRNVYIGTVGGTEIVPGTNYIDIKGGTFKENVRLDGSMGLNSILNIYKKDVTVAEVNGFTDINFYLPDNVVNNDTMLTVTETLYPLIIDDVDEYDYVNVNGRNVKYINVKAGVSGSAALNTGDKVTLLNYTGEDASDDETRDTATDAIEHAKLGTLTVGVSADYDLILSKNADNTQIVATVGEVRKKNNNNNNKKSTGMKPDTKSMVETGMASLAMLNEGADLLATGVMSRAQQDAEAANSSEMTPSFSIGGGKYRLNSGSHVDSKTYNMNLSFAKEIKNSKGKLMLAPFIEYGRGSYDSYLDNGVHGFGDSSFWGVGVMARQTNEDGLYYEGAIHGGNVKTDYDTNSLHDAIGRTPSYDRSNMFYAAHVGIGKVQTISEGNTLDYYGKLFYSHQNSSGATLGTGEHYDFGTIDSVRMLLGAKFTHAINDSSSIYAGAAWQQEFSGSASARWRGMETDAPTLKGATGIMELGYTVKPDNSPVAIDLGVNGKFGKQKGFGVNAKFEWGF